MDGVCQCGHNYDQHRFDARTNSGGHECEGLLSGGSSLADEACDCQMFEEAEEEE